MLDFSKNNGIFKSSLNLSGSDGRTVTLELDEGGTSLLRSRLSRSFYKVTDINRLLSAVEGASDVSEIEKIAEKYYLCDLCDLTDLNLYGAIKIFKVIIFALYRYPMLRSQLCFIGSFEKYTEYIKSLCEGDEKTLKRFGLQYLCNTDTAGKLGELIRDDIEKNDYKGTNTVATAYSAFGLFDAVLINNGSFEGYDYIKTTNNVRYSERIGFHPKGCDVIESVIFHEVGHMLDYTCQVTKGELFSSFYEGISDEEVKEGLSEYALCSAEEFFAEAVAEFYCSSSPRKIAAETVKILDEMYKRRSKI